MTAIDSKHRIAPKGPLSRGVSHSPRRPTSWDSQFDTELLHVLWAVEASLALHAEQARMLGVILDSPMFDARDFPQPSEHERKQAPLPGVQGHLFAEDEEDEEADDEEAEGE